MKKSQIAMLILIASVSVLVAALVLNSVLGDPTEKSEMVKFTDPISSEFAEPSEDIFNEQAINPTVQIIIGSDEATPVSSSSQEIVDNLNVN